KPTMQVQVGDKVRVGQILFNDKKNPRVCYTAPASGTVSAINRGYQRRLLSLVIDTDAPCKSGQKQYPIYDSENLEGLAREQVVEWLLKSGLWTAMRQRPFSKVADPELTPRALFINAMDSNPLAVDPDLVIADELMAFVDGVKVLSKLPQENLYLCYGSADKATLSQQNYPSNVVLQQFKGPHPAGIPGTHIHYLRPAGVNTAVWYLNYQDVIAIGKLFTRGELCMERIISLAGPQVNKPRLIRTQVGANLDEIVIGELKPHETRIISGSVLSGRHAHGAQSYLGRYHLQVSAVREGRERPLLGYLSPGANRHSVMGIYISSFYDKARRFAMSTSTQGSERAMVPIGAYEHIMPLDILPTQLLRSLAVGDLETAQNLGALELDEEDLALCSYVCPGKYDYGPILRDNLTRLENEG
ncbi:MAG: Na(+)-translocating NADH-quinone reductase subunit A, partial [Proteobacteria bacterium]|nr:Na(+)-translocating NADH-quinone reductase subunit A [Pseudomonadota bacterium]